MTFIRKKVNKVDPSAWKTVAIRQYAGGPNSWMDRKGK